MRARAKRIVLQAPRSEDAAEFIALSNASRRLHRGRTSPPSTRAAYGPWLGRSKRPDTRVWFVRRLPAAGGEIAGVVELSQIFLGNFRSAYLGYWIGEPFAARGYMTAGVAAALREAFRTLKLHRVEANIQPGNLPSIALAKRLGFRREGFSPRYLKIAGRWRDHERWALLAEDWKPSRTGPPGTVTVSPPAGPRPRRGGPSRA